MTEADSPKPRKFAAPRGTADVLPGDWPYWQYVRDAAERVCARFGYGRIETPVFEHAGVFLRTAGDATDIVEKEVYLFEDRGRDRLALRPEATASVVRAYLEHGMTGSPQPVRLFYVSPVFRYDRPQAGRYRQHTQFGVEAIGDPDPLVDAEVIDLLWTFVRELGLRDYTLKLNTIGDQACRPAFIEALREYYRPLLPQLCDDCRMRFEKNPLRLLDCKEERCQPAIAAAPRLHDYLCDPCRDHFARLREYLAAQEISFEIDERLVRGLDYYTRTVFECHPLQEGAQSSMGSGGRYDGLAKLLGGPPTPGIGFGAGFERLIINIRRQEVAVPMAPPPTLYVAHLTPEAAIAALTVADLVRDAGRPAIVGGAGRSLKAQMRHANALGALFVAIIGAEEMASGMITLRNLAGHAEQRLPLVDIASVVASQLPA
ncbi:MAG: histidine--tRNA ligase [Chloroflexota bacterium]|nr:histidine--tRNA ligase [Chloroflexota bacterium]